MLLAPALLRRACGAALSHGTLAGAAPSPTGPHLRCASSAATDSAPGSAGPAPPLYAALGVGRGASPAEIKAAFRRRALTLHPDAAAARGRGAPPGPADHGSGSGGSRDGAAAAAPGPRDGRAAAAAFMALVEAYEVLSDPERRQMYDASVDAGLPRTLRTAAAAGARGAGACGDGDGAGAARRPAQRAGWGERRCRRGPGRRVERPPRLPACSNHTRAQPPEGQPRGAAPRRHRPRLAMGFQRLGARRAAARARQARRRRGGRRRRVCGA
jgi:curved DNA-binding protein CbpA